MYIYVYICIYMNMNIPIIIICYNNYKYVHNTLKQIYKINEKYCQNIYILNNCSNCSRTIDFLDNIKNDNKYNNINILHNIHNVGPYVDININRHIYDMMPDKFILTDPDLQFNENIPNNFIDILIEISDNYNCHRVGFALDISDFYTMYDGPYFYEQNIYEWESQFWINKIYNDKYELYNACIDTTFYLMNKSYVNDYCIRVAGDFTAKHIPWYINNNVLSVHDNYILNTMKKSCNSCVSKLIISDINNNYRIINKNNETFLINNNFTNINFWLNEYTSWEIELFSLFDKICLKDKVFIDITSNIGAISIYAGRKSKIVYSFEQNENYFNDLYNNLKTNCDNFTIINNFTPFLIENSETELTVAENKNNRYSLKSMLENINLCEIGLIHIYENENINIILDLFDINSLYESDYLLENTDSFIPLSSIYELSSGERFNILKIKKSILIFKNI